MQTAAKAKKPLSIPERFLGAETRVVSSEQRQVSNFIEAEWLEVSLPEGMPEDQGMLYLFPVDDHKFCLQLCFLHFENERSVNAHACFVRFLPAFFDQYPPETLMANQPFRFDRTTEQQFTVCSKSRALITELQQGTDLSPFIRSLQQSGTAIQLLRCTLECITVPFTVCQVPACRFLTYESEREKIMEACRILDQQPEQPLTIRELSRKVGINECYLKKGIKALTGKTVHDYQQDLRIHKAKTLLQQQGISVTDVANTLGYSSISHFSTAFKRVTGMKPCELLK